MQERNESFDTAPRCVIDQLDSLGRQPRERASEIIDDETEMVQRRAAPVGDEARNTGLRIDRLEELDA